MKLVRMTSRSLLTAYAALTALTFMFQIYVRFGQCLGVIPCGLSLAKGVVWSAIWPAYWPVYLIGFTGMVPMQSSAVSYVANQSSMVSVTTQRYDNARTGQNLSETILNIANVRPRAFGKLFARDVDDEISAQPLYLPKVRVPGIGNRNVLFVATMNNTVYAFDADDPDAGEPLWRVNFSPPGAQPVKAVDVGCKDFGGNIGIVGTPVIDAASQTLYVVARTKEHGSFVQRLHAVDVTTGSAKPNSPVVISANVTGTGTGSENGVLSFDPKIHNQRGSLLLANGIVYITWAGHCDAGPFHGWIMGYDATTLYQVFATSTTPNGWGGGIWQSNTGPAADEDGNLYLTVGNGSATAPDGGEDYGNAVLKLSPLGEVLDWFIPHNVERLNSKGWDLGSSGVLLIPDTNLLASGSKEGKLYLLDRNDFGHFNSASDSQIVQSFRIGRLFTTPTYWSGPSGPHVYTWPRFGRGEAFRLRNHRLKTKPVSTTSMPAEGRPGGILAISANGPLNGTGILWAAGTTSEDMKDTAPPGILRAFDAQDLSRELWNSQQNPKRDNLGSFARFNTPLVANGKVYMATFSHQIVVYGLLDSAERAK